MNEGKRRERGFLLGQGSRGRSAAARRARASVSESHLDSDDLLKRYLPAGFYERLPEAERSWRGRTALLLWALGYPLEMAWSTAMTADAMHARDFEELMIRLDDERLVAQLDATSESRGDGSHLEFVSLGLIRREPT